MQNEMPITIGTLKSKSEVEFQYDGRSFSLINDCRSNFSFMLPSEMIEIRKCKFEGKLNACKQSEVLLWFILEILLFLAL